jgi:Secretion system C-terminal sorting domain
MKHIYHFFILSAALLLGGTMTSQNLVSENYSFSSSLGTYSPLAAGSTLSSGTFDDQIYLLSDLPTFVFNGVSYNAVTISCNGSLSVGATGNIGTVYMPISNNNAAAGIIAPFARDLQGVSGNSALKWGVEGSEIVIEWQGVKRFAMTGESFDFQVRIDSSTGDIRFVYGNFAGIVTNAGDPQIGLRGLNSTDYNNRSVTINETWSTSLQGTANNATCRLNSTSPITAPESGLTYWYSPCSGVAGCLDASACNFNPLATCPAQCEYCGCVESNCGCTDSTACNYNALATFDNGTCEFSCFGCIDETALNYNPQATVDNGTCILLGSGWACDAPALLDCVSNITLGNNENIPANNASANLAGCGVSNSGSIWYVYTSGYNSEITLSTDHLNTDFDTYIQVFTGSCDDLVCIGYNDDGGAALTSLVSFEATTGQTYFIRVGGFGSQTGNFGLTFDCGGGCLDPDACNYDENAPFDNGNCTYGDDCFGCIDESATNFDPIAVYDNNTCTYQTEIVVYYDMNGNGTREFGEPGLSNWPIYIGGLQATFFTNGEGTIDLELVASPFVLELINNSETWMSSTPTTQMIAVPADFSAEFGLMPNTGEAFHISGPYDGFWDIVHCTNGMEDGVYLNNIGGVALNGSITLICDELFTPEADDFGTIAPDLVGPGFAQWNFIEFLPGQSDLFSFHIDGPGVNYIGDHFEFIYDVVLYDSEGNEYFNTEYINDRFVACAYDPNDITANPAGYAEPHYTLPAQRIEYRVRFQNTGNLPAEDVVIVDDLDPAVFNIGSFEPLYGSDSFTTCLHDDGTLDFIFNDIFLPDSASDEEGSHGFVVFSIELQPGLAPGTVINNYADIYFEQNPAITTNTVFHTIFDCGSFVVPTVMEDICVNATSTVDNTQDYVEAYTWSIDGVEISNTAVLELSGMELGEHIIDWSVENPLCGKNESFVLHVQAAPTLIVEMETSVCSGEEIILNATSDGIILWNGSDINGTAVLIEADEIFNVSATNEWACVTTSAIEINALEGPMVEFNSTEGLLTVTGGTAWQWYLDGTMIEGATAAGYEALSEGLYHVVVTGENGCSTVSEAIQVSSVENLAAWGMTLYPHPITNESVLIMPEGIYQVTILDALGRDVHHYGAQQNRMIIRSSEFSAGLYFVQLKNETHTFTMKTIIE